MASSVQYPIWATGRRKTSVARVSVKPGAGRFLVNNASIDEYFKGHVRAQSEAAAPLKLAKQVASFDIQASVMGGGVSGQAGAIKLGVARAFVVIDPAHRTIFKKEGFLKRDPRMVERKKPGQPKARRRFQHSKR